MTNKIALFVIIFIFSSCEPEEIPIDITGIINSNQVDLGEEYCYQKYYDLENNVILGENLTTDWDIAFSNSINESAIILNGSKTMAAIALTSLDLDLLELENNIDWDSNQNYYDHPDGYSFFVFDNETDILSTGQYFLINRGQSPCFDLEDYVIIKINDYDENHYLIEIINLLDDFSISNSESVQIDKTENSQYTYFSFTNNQIVNVANFDWDLCFSRYVEFDVLSPVSDNTLDVYSVVGVLHNSSISVAVDSFNTFSSITANNLNEYLFHSDRNAIGYDWKQYTGGLLDGIYIIDSPVYIIKKSEVDYYKLLFLDFYNQDGQKGCPTFQVEKIEL